jgi:hypothetical protein
LAVSSVLNLLREGQDTCRASRLGLLALLLLLGVYESSEIVFKEVLWNMVPIVDKNASKRH